MSIAGPCRKGKSYILSKAFDQGEVFPLGHFLDPETMGNMDVGCAREDKGKSCPPFCFTIRVPLHSSKSRLRLFTRSLALFSKWIAFRTVFFENTVASKFRLLHQLELHHHSKMPASADTVLRADELEHATPLYSCLGVFIDRFTFRPNFLGMRLPWGCHDQSQDTNSLRHCTGTNFLSPKKRFTKSRSVCKNAVA